MAADGPTAIGTNGGECAGGGGGVVRGNLQSRGLSRSCQPLRMGWPLRWKTVTNVLFKMILQPWLAKRAQTNEGMGKDGKTWPNIVAGGSLEMDARVELATECYRHPIATVTPTVETRGL
jgi:hypothetical protein